MALAGMDGMFDVLSNQMGVAACSIVKIPSAIREATVIYRGDVHSLEAGEGPCGRMQIEGILGMVTDVTMGTCGPLCIV